MPVSLSVGEMQEVAERTNGCIVWGGAIDLSPADDIFVKIEYPLSIDPLLLPSIMSKKKAVGANILVIDIPCGRGTKQSILGRVNTDPQCPIRKSHNHHGGRPDLAQDLDMMLLSRQHSTGLLHSVRLTGTQFTEECWACNSPLYQHLSRPGWHELRPSFWACLNAHHGMHIRIYCRDAHLDQSSGKRAQSDCWISGSCSAKRDLFL